MAPAPGREPADLVEPRGLDFGAPRCHTAFGPAHLSRDAGDDAYARPGSRSGRNRGCLAPSRGPERLAEAGRLPTGSMARVSSVPIRTSISLLRIRMWERPRRSWRGSAERHGLQAIEGLATLFAKLGSSQRLDERRPAPDAGRRRRSPDRSGAALTERREQMNGRG